jgi:signal transduction histidine kinase
MLDPGRSLLIGAACSEERYREHFRGVRIGLEQASIAADAVRSRRPVAVADVTASERVLPDLVERYGSKSLLALPLLARNQPIGVVVLHDSSKLRAWTDAEIQRATLIVNQLGVAVANAQLYEDLKKSYGDLARAQEELVKRERLAALGELAAVVAHEVRNPVAVIFNALSALRKILKLTGDAAMLLGIVGEEADRLNRIVGDLLDFARPSEPALAPEPLEGVIRDTVEAASSEPAAKPVVIKTHVAPEMPEVRIDARMVRQALLNVVINGLQAMPRGGTLTVAAASDVSNGRRWARLEVQDTGPGVPPEVASKIFQPFFTTKATGTGLGLAVVKRIMEAHRGEVLIESRAGEGTKVSLLLPMDDDA